MPSPADYLKITVRRLLRQRTILLINIFGLSIGLAACLLIYLYVQHEYSYDTYHPNADRVARLTCVIHSPGSDVDIAMVPFPAAPGLLRNFPEVGARRWLAGYAYHIDLSGWIYVLPVGVLLLLTLAVTALRVWRLARANPVESLRSD